MLYDEDSYLQLSGIQHFAFCRRQWALIHVENQWAENYRTIDGELMHGNAHDPFYAETRKNLIIKRSVRVFSPSLGISGECDVLELHRADEGISVSGQTGLWQPYPVEYKRGKPGTTEGNALQLCAQAMCLEEMLCCDILRGALYYGEVRRREAVEFTEELRTQVRTMINEMHDLYSRGHTPKVKPHKGCNACSLKEICLPKMLRVKAVSDYLDEAVKNA